MLPPVLLFKTPFSGISHSKRGQNQLVGGGGGREFGAGVGVAHGSSSHPHHSELIVSHLLQSNIIAYASRPKRKSILCQGLASRCEDHQIHRVAGSLYVGRYAGCSTVLCDDLTVLPVLQKSVKLWGSAREGQEWSRQQRTAPVQTFPFY